MTAAMAERNPAVATDDQKATVHDICSESRMTAAAPMIKVAANVLPADISCVFKLSDIEFY